MEIDALSTREKLIETTGLTGGRVLDVGMGGCACMSRLLVRHGFDVVGVDRSAQAVHEARIEGQGQFEARRADAEHLPFAEAEFDAVVAYHTLHHADDAEQVLAEMFRVCRPGGTIMVAELTARGRREYGDIADGGILLRRTGRYLQRAGERLRRYKTVNDILFVCRKPASANDGMNDGAGDSDFTN